MFHKLLVPFYLLMRISCGQDEGFSCAREGELRLTGGRYSGEGRLELCSGGVWGTVCNKNWDVTDASIACADLNFGGKIIAWTAYFSGNTSQPIHIENVNCSGLESRLIDCNTESASPTCDHSMDVGLICVADATMVCTEGQVRLVGGPSMDEGRVEYCIGGQWGTICNETWDANDASVVCNQLGLIPFGTDLSSMAVDSTVPSAGAAGSPIVLSGVQCVGNESTLSQCVTAPTISQCSHARDAGIRCQCPNEMAVRLADGNQENEGRAEYCVDGVWRILCNDGLSIVAAEVVCRQLGYNKITNKTVELITDNHNIEFGYRERGSATVLTYSYALNCNGSENMLLECPTSPLRTVFGICFPVGIGVRCPLPDEGEADEGDADEGDADDSCAQGAVRLSGGRYSGEGRLELCSGGVWGTVCNNNWDITAARIACAELDLNFGGNMTAWTAYFSGNTSQPILIGSVNCSGLESRLIDCNTEPASPSCDHSMDVGLICVANATNVCTEGQLRLVGGPSMDEGRVEYCVGGQWGTICNETWDANDASVVCNQLGLIPFGTNLSYMAVDSTVPSAGAAGSPIVLSGVQCVGNESTLSQCVTSPTISQCSHARDAGIRCQCPNEMALRLADGNQENEGRVEYCVDGVWRILCNEGLSIEAAEVVCRQLGYNKITNKTVELITDNHNISFGYRERGRATDLIYAYALNCDGSENMLLECPTSPIRTIFGTCFPAGIGVRCPLPDITRECDNGEIRLRNGSVSTQIGRVEVCNNYKWGRVCDVDWDDKDAKVACRQLGYEGGIAVRHAEFGTAGDLNFQLISLHCEGNESSLLDCAHDPTRLCFLTNVAGVICGVAQDELHSPRVCEEELFNSTVQPGQNEVFPIGNFGTCEPFHTRSRICKDILSKNVNYIYHTTGSPEQDTIAEELDKLDNTFLQPIIALEGQECINLTATYLCNYFFPSCGSQEGVHLPVSICSRECNFVQARCPHMWNFIDAFLSQYTKLENITCTDITANFSGISPCCSGLDIDVTVITTLPTEVLLFTPVPPPVNLVIPLAGGIMAAIVLILIALLVIVICLHRINMKRKHIVRDIQQEVAAANPISSLELVNSTLLRLDSNAAEPNPYSNFLGFQNDLNFSAPLMSPMFRPTNEKDRLNSALIRDLSSNMLIPYSKLNLLDCIGQGEFGVVYKADYSQPEGDGFEDTLYTVAVKTLKGSFNVESANQILEESMKMKHFDHPNVLSLLGVCLDAGAAPYVILPFMANGSLLSYLKKERSNILLPPDIDDDVRLDVEKRLMIMCFQIASGMEYLAEEKFIHRDLAARNCMIDVHFVIKIADFGLSEDVYVKNYFRQGASEGCIKLPVKWMAPESLNDGVFTEKTDVWSFGVTCWEIFSGGKTPYPGMDPLSLVNMLDSQQRLERPNNAACSEQMYSLMVRCWRARADSRPSFKEIVQTLSGYTETLAGYLDMNSNPFITGNEQAEGLAPPNRLVALYYNITSKLTGKSPRSSPRLSPRVSPTITPRLTPRVSPQPEQVCNTYHLPPSIKIETAD